MFSELALIALGWGVKDLPAYFNNPIRAAVIAVLLFQTGFTIYRRVVRPRPIHFRLEYLGAYHLQLIAYESIFLLGPFCDRRSLGVLEEPTRGWGLALFVLGTLLSAWAILRVPDLFDPAILAEDSHGIALAPGATLPPGIALNPPERQLCSGDFCHGPYRWLRYPTALGQLILLLGLALCFRSWTGVAFAAMLLFATFLRTREMDAAYQRFYGRAWAEYTESTKRFLPLVY